MYYLGGLSFFDLLIKITREGNWVRKKYLLRQIWQIFDPSPQDVLNGWSLKENQRSSLDMYHTIWKSESSLKWFPFLCRSNFEATSKDILSKGPFQRCVQYKAFEHRKLYWQDFIGFTKEVWSRINHMCWKWSKGVWNMSRGFGWVPKYIMGVLN